jgi:hypothetical protein
LYRSKTSLPNYLPATSTLSLSSDPPCTSSSSPTFDPKRSSEGKARRKPTLSAACSRAVPSAAPPLARGRPVKSRASASLSLKAEAQRDLADAGRLAGFDRDADLPTVFAAFSALRRDLCRVVTERV